MTFPKSSKLWAAVLCIALFTAACSEVDAEPDATSDEVGASPVRDTTQVSIANERNATSPGAADPETASATSATTQVFPERLVNLLGSAWLISDIDGSEFDGGLSFGWVETDGLVGWYRDDCATGEFTAVVDGPRELSFHVVSSSPPPSCFSPLAAALEEGARIDVSLRRHRLTLQSAVGEINAFHWQSTSIQTEVITSDEIPDLDDPIEFIDWDFVVSPPSDGTSLVIYYDRDYSEPALPLVKETAFTVEVSLRQELSDRGRGLPDTEIVVIQLDSPIGDRLIIRRTGDLGRTSVDIVR